jgi:transposase, IS5 family
LIRYTPQSQLSFPGFETSFHQQLDLSNRWVVLCNHIPWDNLANIYYKNMRADFGAPTLDARMVIGAVIIKHMLNIDDREVIEQIRENIYLQYFVGLKSFQTSAPFDASLMVSIRKRLGKDVMDQFNEQVLREAGVIPKADREPLKSTDQTPGKQPEESTDIHAIAEEKNGQSEDKKEAPASTNSGTLLLDATVAEQQIEYPTDLKLLNESRQHLERMIAQICEDLEIKQPRMYKQTARKKYLNLAKKKKKTKNQIRTAIRQQLQYVRRDLGYINDLIEKNLPVIHLRKRDWTLLRVISEVWRQQQEMYENRVHSTEDRIVSIYQPHVRPIPRGKDKASTEFGSKQLIMLKDGYTHVYTIGWDNYNEGTRLQESVEVYRTIYGCYPEAVSADRIFGNRANRKFMKDNGIRFIGKALGRPVAMSHKEKKGLQKEMRGRNAIEGKFGQGKNGYGLAKIKARLKDTSESWIMSIYFVMNLVKLAQASFLSFLLLIFGVMKLFGKHIFSSVLINQEIAGYQRGKILNPIEIAPKNFLNFLKFDLISRP